MATIRHQAARAAFGAAADVTLKYLNKDPENREKSLLKIVDLTESFAKDRFKPESYEAARAMIRDKDSKWMQYVNRIFDEVSPNVIITRASVTIPITNTSNKKSVSRKPNPIPAIKESMLVIQAHITICLAEITSVLIFLGLGIYMIVKAIKEKPVEEKKEDVISIRQIVIWACITSIDSFIAGIGFGFLETDFLLMVFVIGIVTLALVMIGMYIGYWMGCQFRRTAVTIGGCILLFGAIELVIRTLYY